MTKKSLFITDRKTQKITLSLSTDAVQLLQERARTNLRSMSKEVEFLLLQAERNTPS